MRFFASKWQYFIPKLPSSSVMAIHELPLLLLSLSSRGYEFKGSPYSKSVKISNLPSKA
jgi:hypothetical protein